MQLLQTERLRLEPQQARHADEMFLVLADPALYQYENAPPHSAAVLRERYARLEARCSPDGAEQWLNWVLRLQAGGALIGYVQATVHADGRAGIAYELNSAHWGRGLAFEAVTAMLSELQARYGAQRFSAVLKAHNARSLKLLQRLGFDRAEAGPACTIDIEADELLMLRSPASAA